MSLFVTSLEQSRLFDLLNLLVELGSVDELILGGRFLVSFNLLRVKYLNLSLTVNVASTYSLRLPGNLRPMNVIFVQ